MRYHVPRDGFVWHSDSVPKKRVPATVWVGLFAGFCFVAGLATARLWSPAAPVASSSVVGERVRSEQPVAPLQPRVWSEPTGVQQAAVGEGAVEPLAPRTAAVPAPQVKLVNPDADEASIDPSLTPPQVESKWRDKPARVRVPRTEQSAPMPLPRTAPSLRDPSGYSAMRQQLFDRAP